MSFSKLSTPELESAQITLMRNNFVNKVVFCESLIKVFFSFPLCLSLHQFNRNSMSLNIWLYVIVVNQSMKKKTILIKKSAQRRTKCFFFFGCSMKIVMWCLSASQWHVTLSTRIINRSLSTLYFGKLGYINPYIIFFVCFSCCCFRSILISILFMSILSKYNSCVTATPFVN